MRDYNAEPSHTDKLHFVGFDPLSTRAASELITYLCRVDPRSAPAAERALEPLSGPLAHETFGALPAAEQQTTRRALAQLTKRIDTERASYVARSNAGAWSRARAFARVIERAAIAYGDYSSRDDQMRDMLRDQVAQFPAGTGFLLNAHNQHIAAEAHNLNHMGVLLREEWGKGFVAIGTAFSSGSVYAADWTQGPSNTFAVHHPGRAPLDTLDGALSLAGLPAFLIDLRQSPAPSPPGSIRRNGSASSAAATLVTHHLSSSSHLPGRTMP